MNKKTQIVVGQIFGYLVTIFVIAFILVFGYRSIANLREKGTEADYLQFKKEIETAVKLNKAFGDSSNEALTIPGQYNKVCFVSSSLIGLAPSFSASGYPIIQDSVRDGIKKNVFLVKENAEESFFVDGVEVHGNLGPGVNNDFGCIDIVGGKINIKFTGSGDKTLISEWLP